MKSFCKRRVYYSDTLQITPPASRQPPACKPSSCSDNRNGWIGPSTSWFRNLNHQLTAKSTQQLLVSPSKLYEVAIRRSKQRISMSLLQVRSHQGSLSIKRKSPWNRKTKFITEFSLAARSPSEFAPAGAWPSSLLCNTRRLAPSSGIENKFIYSGGLLA